MNVLIEWTEKIENRYSAVIETNNTEAARKFVKLLYRDGEAEGGIILDFKRDKEIKNGISILSTKEI